MKYLKQFNTHSQYETYTASTEFITPNVSLCKDTMSVGYHPYADKYNGYDYVDLGLPSGNIWARYNVGASNETDSGLYFAWGETQGYTAAQVGTDKQFSWSDYKYGDASSDVNNLTKYNSTDGKSILDLEDDAARANMGGEWRMPNLNDILELLENTNVVWTTNHNNSGFTGIACVSKTDNNKYLLFPAAGGCNDGSVVGVGYWGDYWGSIKCPFNNDDRFTESLMYFLNESPQACTNRTCPITVQYTNCCSRCSGRPVRGVIKPKQ